MTRPHEGAEGELENDTSSDEVAPQASDPTAEELDALAYEGIAHTGSLVPRSLLDFLQ